MIPATNRPAQPLRWQQQWREAVSDPHELLAMLGLEALREQVFVPSGREFALRVPRGFVARMRHGDPNDPLLRQVLPLTQELRLVPEYGADAVGDLAARGATGVIHKYAGRALLIASGTCAINCRFCFRRHFPYAEETAASDRWRGAVEYLAVHTDIAEVILSGGDPLSLATAKLAELTSALRPIGHLQRLRIHTRLPIVLPSRIDTELSDWLANLPWPVAVVLHTNHANEIDDDVAAACAHLRATGAVLLNQSVLLAGVNDDAAVLAKLSERLFGIGVLPYYLNLLDRVAGAAHFEVEEARARAMHESLRRSLPGYLVPRLVREVVGEPYKRPV